ncbi:hypothetical protein CHI95_23255 [Providencia rettgeri]|uniref:Uncharacterized protein n=1 Tax=Providencia rettgeri TaxID=587 RepID=A0A264VLL0_PRORE|nr:MULTISPECIES: hypothetical protein [Providencia]OZS72155.1 hypothetical protein CHI95_23255 [Providencia rettgeri]
MSKYQIRGIHGLSRISEFNNPSFSRNIDVSLKINDLDITVPIDTTEHNVLDMTLRDISKLAYDLYSKSTGCNN